MELATRRIFIQSLAQFADRPVLLRGWVHRLRVLSKTAFLILRDCSGQAQCVAAPEALKDLHLKSEDTVEIHGRVRLDERAPGGLDVDILCARVLNLPGNNLRSTASSPTETPYM